MKSNIFVPKRINVGFQERSSTYTGKLAYVIYYDEKGTLRKEKSWNGWRNKEIPNEEFDNVPTEGFVLNKHVGGYASGWEHRNSYCRVYDPRNFEYEISIENLLYILECCDSIKGKGLQGEFVYAWDGVDLLLLPVESTDYKNITEFNEIIHKNECIKAKDLIVGATYLTKDNHERVYMGKFDKYDRWSTFINNQGKYFWFYNGTYFEKYRSIPKNKFIKCINDQCAENYAEMFDKMESDPEYSPYDKSKDEFIQMSYEEMEEKCKSNYIPFPGYSSTYMLFQYKDKIEKYELRPVRNENAYQVWRLNKPENGYYYGYSYTPVLDIFPTEEIEEDGYSYAWMSAKKTKQVMIPVALREIYEVMHPVYKQTYLANGREYKKEYNIYE